MKLIQQMALVSEVSAREISPSHLSRASAALQKQLTRDFGPIWDVDATVDAFPKLEDVPLPYWPILIQDDIHTDAAGVHEDKNGQPFALVQYSNQWTLTASHEMLEMAVDPFGNRLFSSQSVKDDQGRVEYLVEVCDPCEDSEFAYRISGVLVSDFYTPNYFDPVKADGVRYSFTGAITEPKQVLHGGYLSWHDPPTNHWWQELWLSGDKPTFEDIGVLDAANGSLRSQIDRRTPVPAFVENLPDQNAALLSAQRASAQVEESTLARAKLLRDQIAQIKQATQAKS
jgi:hypothetical protein